jgi:hypothetical protein
MSRVEKVELWGLHAVQCRSKKERGTILQFKGPEKVFKLPKHSIDRSIAVTPIPNCWLIDRHRLTKLRCSISSGTGTLLNGVDGWKLKRGNGWHRHLYDNGGARVLKVGGDWNRLIRWTLPLEGQHRRQQSASLDVARTDSEKERLAQVIADILMISWFTLQTHPYPSEGGALPPPSSYPCMGAPPLLS